MYAKGGGGGGGGHTSHQFQWQEKIRFHLYFRNITKKTFYNPLQHFYFLCWLFNIYVTFLTQTLRKKT